MLGLHCCARAFSRCGDQRATHCYGVQASHCSGLYLQSSGSRCMGFSSCGIWAQLLRGLWNLPGSRIRPMSSALAGGFLSTVPPGKPEKWHFLKEAVKGAVFPMTVRIWEDEHLGPNSHICSSDLDFCLKMWMCHLIDNQPSASHVNLHMTSLYF